MNNPFFIREDLVKAIKIKANSDNFYTSIKMRNKEESIFNSLKKFFTNMLRIKN